MSDLLLEIGTEEIPAAYIEPALEQLAGALERLLAENRLAAESVRATGTPRRLTVAASGVPEQQAPVREEIVGPPAGAAFKEDGSPGKAASGFARAQGVPVESLTIKDTPKGPYVAAVVEHEGAPALQLLPGLLQQAVSSLSFPKSMVWPLRTPDDGPPSTCAPEGAFRFARPIRRVVALFGCEVVPVEIAGVRAGRTTYGHPFLAPDPIELRDASFDVYGEALKEAYVLMDLKARRETIRSEINLMLSRHGSSLHEEALLDEVTNLVEYPHAVEGGFDEGLLGLPDCVLVAAMKEHQRYFPVRDGEGRLLARFICVSNRSAAQEDAVREGNERVLRARLEDARFFWEEDRRTALAQRVPLLKDVVYLGGLGNNLQRSERLGELSTRIAHMMGLTEQQIEHVRRTARLCKADLLTGVVGEFPSLQGVVGRELALKDGEPPEVADAIAEHYRPTGADDELPSGPVSIALALADKLDVMAGCFALGLLPSGSQDPYALRRNALGILLILEKKQLDLHLHELVRAAAEVLARQAPSLSAAELEVPVDELLEFFRDRLYHAGVDRGFAHDLVRATLAVGFNRGVPEVELNYNVRNFWKRLAALSECAGREWWPALVELVDRTFRIQRDLDVPLEVREQLLQEQDEKELWELYKANRGAIVGQFENEQYSEAAQRYCSALARKVHVFFDNVFVNVEDEALQRNRKSLCGEIYYLFADRFADLYLIEAAGSAEHS